jgi:hypothetical protein
MNIFQNSNLTKGNPIRSIAGFLLIVSGAALFLDRFLNTGWISYSILPTAGVILFVWGVRQKKVYIILAAGLIGGAGLGIAAAVNSFRLHQNIAVQFGLLALYFGIGWMIAAATALFIQKPIWWAIVPAGVLIGLGYALSRPFEWVNLVLYLGLGTGLALLAWGLAARLIGLVIPGCLLFSSGLGIYFAWSLPEVGNSLVHTGIMLVWFALGWALITLSGRVLIHKFLWWPLIPGGILAMVGCGLYIGGDPGNALNFISNTGSIGLMIFGLYLLLMRKGIHH